MFKFTYSAEKNRIYINVEGDLSPVEVEAYIRELTALVDKAEPKFTVLADLTASRISFLEKSAEFQPVREYSAAKGLKNVATVVGKEAYELHKITPFPGMKNSFLAIKEAEAFLDGAQ